MIKAPKGDTVGGTSASLAGPASVVILVLLIGATFYLWRARYIRRRTAYVVMVALILALIGVGAAQYLNPMRGFAG